MFLRKDNGPRDLGLASSSLYSVKNAYNDLRLELGDMEIHVWSRVWKVNVPRRYKTFLGLVLHGTIMTNEERARRYFKSDAYLEG